MRRAACHCGRLAKIPHWLSRCGLSSHPGDTIQEDDCSALALLGEIMAKNTKVRVNTNPPGAVADLPLDTSLFTPGDRICVAVSGGADSTALLRTLLARREELGIVLSVLHVEHGLRGQSAIRDAEFVRTLAEQLGLPCEIVSVDTPQRIAEHKESVETAARALRYQVIRECLAAKRADKVATAHTLDDQAETVLMKLLRGAWTDGLGGIHPIQQWGKSGAAESREVPVHGSCVRPFLAVQRVQIEAYLLTLGQRWCEDETNHSLAPTRNRIRHELLPLLRAYNPRIEQTLAHMAANARAEEQHWHAELARLLPLLLLPGKPARGGGRSVSTAPGEAAAAMEIARLKDLDPGLLRRVLRAAAERFGGALDFEMTERLLSLMESGAHGSTARTHLELPRGVCVERSARELRFQRSLPAVETRAGRRSRSASTDATAIPVYDLPIPGTVDAPAFRATFTATMLKSLEGNDAPPENLAPLPAALVRAWHPGDRVELLHSRGPKKVKEVLSHMRIAGDERARWPVVVWMGRIIWMRGVQLANGQNLYSKDRVGEAALGSYPDISETQKSS